MSSSVTGKFPDLILLGAPGSGKGTQSELLIKNFSFKHLSTGDLLRKEIAEGSEIGLKVKKIMQDGNLVSDELVIELIKINYKQEDGSSYIFDGFPRTKEQADALSKEVLKNRNFQAVYFKVDESLVIDRLSSRRMCKGCGAIFNIITNKPSVENICDKCGGNLHQRDDDKGEVIKSRLEVFSKTIGPVIEFYRAGGNLLEVDASAGTNDVFDQISKKIKNALV